MAPTHSSFTGNPNCGKTTIFNALTGLRAKVGNYAGGKRGLKARPSNAWGGASLASAAPGCRHQGAQGLKARLSPESEAGLQPSPDFSDSPQPPFASLRSAQELTEQVFSPDCHRRPCGRADRR